MIERNEFRVGTTTLEWRAARWSLGGWQPLTNGSEVIDFDDRGIEGAFKVWQNGPHGRVRKRCFSVIDDSLVRYAMVPAFEEARSVREYEVGARLRCETLFGWSPDRWTVQVALPPRAGAVLCCAYRTVDGLAWRAGAAASGDSNPTIVPGAIAAFNQHRTRLIEDGWVVVASATGCVAVLMRKRSPAAVHQTRLPPEQSWDDDYLQQWLESLSALTEAPADTEARCVIDTRDWKYGSRLAKGLDQFA